MERPLAKPLRRAAMAPTDDEVDAAETAERRRIRDAALVANIFY